MKEKIIMNISALTLPFGYFPKTKPKRAEKPKKTKKPGIEVNDPWQSEKLEKGDVRASFFYLNDLHSSMDNMPYIKLLSDSFNDKYKDITTFKVTGGDMKAGIGKHYTNIAVDFMNSIGVELSALGNHEFDRGLSEFSKTLPKWNTKFVVSNVEIDNPKIRPFFKDFDEFNEKMKSKSLGIISNLHREKKIFNSCVVEKNGEKYGYIGAAYHDKKFYRPSLNGFNLADRQATILSLQKEIDKLKEKGINKIIMLSHLGTAVDEKIVPKLEGVDIVIGGHDHRVTRKPIKLMSKSDEPVLLVQAGREGYSTGILDVVFDEDGIIKDHFNEIYDSQTERIPEKTVTAIWDKYFKRAKTIASISEDFIPEKNKKRENTMANFFAEAHLVMDHKTCDKTKRKTEPADLAFMINSGKIRKNNLKKGEITNRDIIAYNPWGDRVYKTNMSGQTIIDIIKLNSFDSGQSLIHTSNLKYSMYLKENSPDNIIQDLKIIDPKKVVNGEPITERDYQPIDPDGEYMVLFDDLFLSRDLDGISISPVGDDANTFRKVLRQIEKGKVPEGYEKTSIHKWDKADAVVNYMKELYTHKIDDEDKINEEETLLDLKLNKYNRSNKKINMINSEYMTKEERIKNALSDEEIAQREAERIAKIEAKETKKIAERREKEAEQRKAVLVNRRRKAEKKKWLVEEKQRKKTIRTRKEMLEEVDNEKKQTTRTTKEMLKAEKKRKQRDRTINDLLQGISGKKPDTD